MSGGLHAIGEELAGRRRGAQGVALFAVTLFAVALGGGACEETPAGDEGPWRDEVIATGVRLRDYLIAPDGRDVARYEWIDYFAFDWEVIIAARAGDGWTVFDRWDDDGPAYRGDAWWLAAGADRLYMASPVECAWSPLVAAAWTEEAPPAPPPARTPIEGPGNAAADPASGTLAIRLGASVGLLSPAGTWVWESIEPRLAAARPFTGGGGLAWDENGALHACYPVELPGGRFALRHARRSPAGWALSAVAEDTTAFTGDCDVAAAPGGAATVAYVAYPGDSGLATLHVADDRSGTWVAAAVHEGVAAIPSGGRWLALDPAGDPHVLAVEAEGACAGVYARCPGYRFVHGARSTDGWVFEPIRSFTYYRGEPLWIDVTSDGEVHAAWQDYVPAAGTFDAHLAIRATGGATPGP